MILILHDLKDPKLWELWYVPYLFWVMQDLHHQPYLKILFDSKLLVKFRPRRSIGSPKYNGNAKIGP